MNDAENIADFYRALATTHLDDIHDAVWSLGMCGMLEQALKGARDRFAEFDVLGAKQFDTLWRNEGTNIRLFLRADVVPIIRAYRHLNPPYAGDALILFRGEGKNRHHERRYGLSWTTHESNARPFAAPDRRQFDGGGIVVRTVASGRTIVAKIGEHASGLWEREYMLDPDLIGPVMEVCADGCA